jgi:signal transduction histidine kinase
MNAADLNIEGLIHDLNNVFQTIAESAELLSSDPKWAKLAATLHRSVERGQRILGSIGDRRRSNAQLATVLEGATQFVRDYLELIHGPELSFESKIEPGFCMPGDAASWERVFVNLLMNSVEAGGRTIAVTAEHGEIEVADDGPGIAPGLLASIFQPHVSTKPITSGLGLYIVRSLVEQNGGTVTAANGENGGAIFRIRVGEHGARPPDYLPK